MSFKSQVIQGKGIRNVVHVGADRGGELPEYKELGVEKVVWVEANPEVYQELLENLQIMNIKEVESLPFHQLIADRDDAAIDFHLYYGKDAGHLVGNKGMSSMLRARDEWVASCYQKTLRLNALTLDTFLVRNRLGFEFDLLTMDTQGSELMIARGAANLLKSVRYIHSEVTIFNPQYQHNTLFGELSEYFSRFGFKHLETHLQAYNWGDALFVKES